MVSIAAGLAALLSGVAFAPQSDPLPQPARPQIDVARDGADTVVRISLQEMASVRGAPLSSAPDDAWRSSGAIFGGDFASGGSGVHTIAVATGAGSTAQATTSISMNVRLTGLGF
jgi:hypothetical protein